MTFGIPSVPQGGPSVGGGNTIATTYWDYLKAHPLPGNPLTFERGSGPLSPGDVISYGDRPPGHVGIVIAVNTHAKTYTIIEQNPAGDTTTLGYNNGIPAGDGKAYPVVGWLHITM